MSGIQVRERGKYISKIISLKSYYKELHNLQTSEVSKDEKTEDTMIKSRNFEINCKYYRKLKVMLISDIKAEIIISTIWV